MLEDPEAISIGSITGPLEVNLEETFVYVVDAPLGLEIQWTVNGGSVVSGQGTATIEVQWDKVSNGSVMATAITEAGCSSSEVSLEGIVADLCVSAGIQITATLTHPTCQGDTDGMIEAVVTGAHPEFSYTWSGNVKEEDPTDLAAGTYSLTVTDSAGCEAHAEFILEEAEAPVLGAITGSSEASPDGSYSYSINGSEELDILWTVEGGSLVSGQGTSMVEVQWTSGSMGSISAIGTSPSGCVSNEVSLEVSIESMPTSIGADGITSSGVYPNPVRDILFVKGEKIMDISVYDMTGQVIIQIIDRQVDLSGLKAGMYLIKLEDVDGTGLYKILKQ
jgi:hypothetical protein